MTKDKTRIDIIDLWRFIGCFLIMGHHCYYIKNTVGGGYYIEKGWIFVEWFFMVMGYFTCRHFVQKNDGGNIAKNSIAYTLEKFKDFIPYVLIAVTVEYVYEALPLLEQGIKPFLKSFVQLRDKYMLALISWTVPVLYYGYIGVIGEHTYPFNLLRTFAGLTLGILTYFSSAKISIFKNINSKLIFLLTFIEVSSLLFVLISVLKNWQYYRLNLMAFAIGNILMLSGITGTSKIKAKWMIFLGKISMPLFIIHWSIGTVVNYYFSDKSYVHKVIIYYIGTFIVALLSYTIIERLKISLRMICAKNERNKRNAENCDKR